MNITPLTYLGLLAAACTTAAFVPQVVRAARTRRTRDISLGMYAVLCLGLFLWLVYGLILRDLPLIAANAVSLTLALWVLILKLRHG